MTVEPILIRQADGTFAQWTQPETSAYENESHLQEVLASHPTQIPGVVEGSIAVREFHTSAGPIDICVLSPNGRVTVVECKLEKNSEKRRMVVGQLIDYASALRSDGVKRFRETWSSKSDVDLDSYLDPDAVLELETSINAGRINLCLAVDQIDEDIQRLVEYLNLITADSVMVTALQLAYAKLGSIEVLIPSTFGAEIAHSKKVGSTEKSEKWTWETFIDSLIDDGDKAFANELHQCVMAHDASGGHQPLWFGTSPKGSIFFHIHRARYAPFGLWINSNKRLNIFGTWRQWQALRDDERFSELAKLFGQTLGQRLHVVQVDNIDIDELWRVAVDCDLAINNLTSQ
jgi:hypothetical protein